jgi:cell division protein FtsN
MTRDYRKGAPPSPRRREQRRGTCAFWFLFGGVLGGFGVGLAWMMHEPPPNAAGVTAGPATASSQPAPKPKFDFYSLLPEEEVVVPAETPVEPVQLPPAAPLSAPPPQATAPQPAATAAPATPAPTPASGGDYLVQVGSFRKNSDAERLKAELAMLGIQTSIQTVTIDNGQTYHRVRTVAYDKAGASAVQAKLKQNGHDSMMMRAR